MRISIAVSVLALTLLSLAANAADSAGEAVERGLRFMGKGEYDHALREFLEAKHLAPTPRTSAQIAIAEQALEHFVDAEIHLMDVLQAEDDPWVRAHRDELEQSLAAIRAQLGSLMVRGDPRGADVRLQGELIGTVPMRRALRLRKGKVAVQVDAAGFVGKAQTVEIVAGQTTTIDVDLARSPIQPQPPKPVVVNPPTPTPTPTPTSTSTSTIPPPPVPGGTLPPPDPLKPAVSDPYRADRLTAWVYTAVGALSLAAGGYLWAYGKSGPGGQDIGKGLVGVGAAALVCGSMVVIASQPVQNGKSVSLAGEGLLLTVGGRF
jgi:hypothetical protein